MSEDKVISPASQGWRGWAAAGFAAVWGAVGALAIPGPERGIMEDAAAYSGKLFGTGMAYGLIAAMVAHLLILRGSGRKAKVLTYLAGMVAGGLVAMLLGG